MYKPTRFILSFCVFLSQGGSAGGVALTAYVLISLMENADNQNVSKVYDFYCSIPSSL